MFIYDEFWKFELLKALIILIIFIETAGTLFRGNCLASKLLSAFCYQVSSQFLKNILLAPITYIADSPDNYEVNPVKMPKGENLEKNIENLCEAVKFFLNSIILGLPHCPL